MSCYCLVFTIFINSVLTINVYFRLVSSEDVQYFQIDQDGNMYVFEPGSGFSGNCQLVRPGDDSPQEC